MKIMDFFFCKSFRQWTSAKRIFNQKIQHKLKYQNGLCCERLYVSMIIYVTSIANELITILKKKYN